MTIKKGTRVRTASVTEAIAFQILAGVVVPAGATPPAATGALEHSEPEEELLASTGLPNHEVTLPATSYLDVAAGNGVYVARARVDPRPQPHGVARRLRDQRAPAARGRARADAHLERGRGHRREHGHPLRHPARRGGLPSQALKDAVEQQVTVVYPCTLTFQVSVQDSSYLDVDVQATVHLRQGANAAAVRARRVAAT